MKNRNVWQNLLNRNLFGNVFKSYFGIYVLLECNSIIIDGTWFTWLICNIMEHVSPLNSIAFLNSSKNRLNEKNSVYDRHLYEKWAIYPENNQNQTCSNEPENECWFYLTAVHFWHKTEASLFSLESWMVHIWNLYVIQANDSLWYSAIGLSFDSASKICLHFKFKYQIISQMQIFSKHSIRRFRYFSLIALLHAFQKTRTLFPMPFRDFIPIFSMTSSATKIIM